MASTFPTNPSTPATNFAPMAPGQAVYLMPAQQRGGQPRNVRPVPGIKCLSIATIVIASVLAALGIVAVCIQARGSYLGDAIWTGLLFLLPTGILGLLVHGRRTSFCMNIAFLVMTLVSSAAAFQLFVYTLISAFNEFYYCNPEVHWDYWDYDYDCPPQWSRVLVDVAIVLCAVAALVLVIISSSVTLYGTVTCCFTCCQKCCMNNNPPSMVQYSPYAGVAMAAPMNGRNVQVMTAPQMMSHGSTTAQQANQQPHLVVALQTYLQNAPPAYMAANNVNLSIPPQTGVISGQQTVTAGNQLPTVSSVPVAEHGEGKPVEADPGSTVQPSAPGQIAINPQNTWQTF